MKKANLKEVYSYINQTTEKEVDFESKTFSNGEIEHIIRGKQKINKPKNQSSMTTKQFQDYVIQFISNQKSFNEYVIEFIQEQKEMNKKQLEFNQRQEETNKKQAEFNQYVIEFINEQKEMNKKQLEFNQRQEEINKIVLQRLDKIENEIKAIKSCPTIQKELSSD